MLSKLVFKVNFDAVREGELSAQELDFRQPREITYGYLQSLGQPRQSQHGHVVVAALHSSHIAPIHLRE